MYATRIILALAVMAMVVSIEGKWTAGPSYTSLYFNGEVSATIPASASKNAGKEFSFEAWIKVPTTTSSESKRTIVSRYDSSIVKPTDQQNDFALFLNAQGHLVLILGGEREVNGVTEAPILIVSNKTLTANKWYHVAFTIEYTSVMMNAPSKAVLYVDSYNANKVLSRERVQQLWYGPAYARVVLINENFVLGKYHNNQESKHYFTGAMDDVRIWRGRRLPHDIDTFSHSTVENIWYDSWAANSTLGGTSANTLVVSFNMNDKNVDDGKVKLNDKSGNNAHAVWFAKTENTTAQLSKSSTDESYIQSAYAHSSVPVQIPLYTLNTDDMSDNNYTYVIQYLSNQIYGEIYEYDPSNSSQGASNSKPLLPSGVDVPSWGARIASGSQPRKGQDSIVFIYNASSLAVNARFYYYSISGSGVRSNTVEVRVTIECPGNASANVDTCGLCNGKGRAIDACGDCFGSLKCMGCDGVLNSGKKLDVCGECGGNGSSCLFCDGTTTSGWEYDACGVCGGNNGTCKGCDGSGGGVLDACGVCNGKNDTCGGCDGFGGVYDDCGDCGGDNSRCTCVKYHGYHIQEMDYLLLQWGLTHSVEDIDHVLEDFKKSLDLLSTYNGDLDLASVVLYLNHFLGTSLSEYESTVDAIINELNTSLGLRAM